ncbi:MAG: ribonucleotide-diphosphate reductase subunit beta [Pseudomonadales bacterium]|nr:MAG: ribonucleotide-diphosphate reductase subunit beta [Pseudomonadales bacterium]
MTYSIFCQTKNNALTEPMFFGQPVNVARYDQQKHPIFEQIIEKQLSFFWRPEEVDVSRDRMDFANLSSHEQHIFLSNLKYQTLLDSIQGRSPNVVLLPLVSIPELETWIETWSFSETVHSRSYTHIIRNIVNDPSVIFDDIMDNEEILKRASLPKLKRLLYLCLMAINVLEAIRFYVSFACSFAFAERKLMEGNAKIIKLIARDEALHLTSTQHMLNLMRTGKDDPDMVAIAEDCYEDCIEIFRTASEQEKEWAEYLFKDGSMIGMNKDILCQYIEYITNLRMEAVGLPAIFPNAKSNPIPWINTWLSSDNVQVAPQETEISSYLVGQIDADLSDSDFDDFEL